MQPFYWGNSVSSMQTEGGWNQGGKSLSVYDVRWATRDLSDWKVANDNYNNYEEDLDLLQELGANMYRFQISWSRVVVDGDGDLNEEGLAYYDRFIDALIERNIEPMVCLYHFDMPLHLAQEYSGFLSKHVKDAFVRYVRAVVDRFGQKVKYWITFNEQNIFQFDEGFNIGGYTASERSLQDLYRMSHNVMVCHAEASNYIHDTTDGKVGGMVAFTDVYPATCDPADIEAVREYDEFVNYHVLDAFAQGRYSDAVLQYAKNRDIDLNVLDGEMEAIARQKSDYLAFSYYFSTTINASKIPEGTPPNYYLSYGKQDNPHLETSDFGWQIDPTGFRDVLNKLYQRYRIPVFPIENGIGMRETWDGEHQIQDDYRIAYHHSHIQAMFDAMDQDGVECLGYLGWGLIDILSSKGDMEKRYGVVYVNRGNHDLRDMKRVPKKSFEWLKGVFTSNGRHLG